MVIRLLGVSGKDIIWIRKFIKLQFFLYLNIGSLIK